MTTLNPTPFTLGDTTYTITKNLLTSTHRGHEVYLAGTAHGQQVILKCATTPEHRTKLQLECELMEGLQSDPHTAHHIPHCYGFYATTIQQLPDVLAMGVFTYIESDWQWINYLEVQPSLVRQAQLLQPVVDCFKATVSVLRPVHERGIVHGDLKWQNIIVDKAGEVYLIDWDHSRRLNEPVTTANQLTGTPQYLPTEYLLGQPRNVQFDIYTLGMICLAMVYGSYITPRYAYHQGKFVKRTNQQIVDAIAQGETAKYYLLPLPRSAVEVTYQMIWQKMTQADPKLRYQSLGEILV